MAGIGKRRHIIQFIQIESTQDANGKWVEQPHTVLGTFPAGVRQVDSNTLGEYEGQLGLNNTLDFEVRYPAEFPINTNVFILYANRTYRIVNIKKINELLKDYRIRGESRDPATIEL